MSSTLDRPLLRGMARRAIERSAMAVQAISADLVGELVRAAELIRATFDRGGKILLFGNGGSAAIAQHLAAELVGRFRAERMPLAAIALVCDGAVLTGLADDSGYEEVFSRQVRALGRAGDVAIVMSASGTSPNILRAAETARSNGLTVIAMTGSEGRPLSERSDLCIRIPSSVTARVQECHLTIGHVICELVDATLLSDVSETTLHTDVGRDQKHVALSTLLARRAKWREQGLSVVWTNGCFDVVHAGHVSCLRAARRLGDLLVVGVNSDASVRVLKGATRPIFPLVQRLAVLSAFEMVDHLVVFDDPTPVEIIASLRPDVFCKGADYAPSTGRYLAEASVVEKYGGRVEYLPMVEGVSTTDALKRILDGRATPP
jgi:rfaE bifunctional protein nucleotidyltransferase chain/domain